MDKLIKASEAVDIVAKHSALYGNGEVSADEGETLLYDIMSELTNLPPAEPDGCISCSERFRWHPAEEPPNDNRHILVSFANYSEPLVGRFEGNENEGWTAYVGDTEERFIDYDLIVDGWWELPRKEIDQ